MTMPLYVRRSPHTAVFLMPENSYQRLPDAGAYVMPDAYYLIAIKQGDLVVLPHGPAPVPPPPAAVVAAEAALVFAEHTVELAHAALDAADDAAGIPHEFTA